MQDAAVFQRDGACWIPGPDAKGPFPGQHGGALAGLLATVLDAQAADSNAGTTLHFSTLLLRAAPIAPCTVTTKVVRSGGRVTVLAACLEAGGKECAVAQAIYVRPQDVGHWPLPADQLLDPLPSEPVPLPTAFGAEPWFRDTVDIRRSGDVFWMRSRKPVVVPMSPMATVCAHADWASGLSRRDTFDDPKVAGFPNADLSIHLGREARGEWIGLRPKSTWFATGMGTTDTELFDVFGPIGRACHTLVLLAQKTSA